MRVFRIVVLGKCFLYVSFFFKLSKMDFKFKYKILINFYVWFFYRREGSFVDLEGLVCKDENLKRRSRGFKKRYFIYRDE